MDYPACNRCAVQVLEQSRAAAADMHRQRQIEPAGDSELTGEKMLLLFIIERTHIAVDTHLTDADKVRILHCGLHLALERCEILLLRFRREKRVDPEGVAQIAVMRNLCAAVPVIAASRTDNNINHAGGTRSGNNLVEVTVKNVRLKVRMGVNPLIHALIGSPQCVRRPVAQSGHTVPQGTRHG